jgi:addiction module HigA family antidote
MVGRDWLRLLLLRMVGRFRADYHGGRVVRKKPNRIPFPHPGETIREDYLKPLGMSVNRLAIELRVPATRMLEVVRGRRGITADTALRLARYFNTTPKFWLNLQTSYDLAVTGGS